MFTEYLRKINSSSQESEDSQKLFTERFEGQVNELAKVFFVDSQENILIALYGKLIPLGSEISKVVAELLEYQNEGKFDQLIQEIRELRTIIHQEEIKKPFDKRNEFFDENSPLRKSLGDRFNDIEAWEQLFYNLNRTENTTSCLYCILGHLEDSGFEINTLKPNPENRLSQALNLIVLEKITAKILSEYKSKGGNVHHFSSLDGPELYRINNFLFARNPENTFDNFKTNSPDFTTLSIFISIESLIEYKVATYEANKADFDLESLVKNSSLGNIPNFEAFYTEAHTTISSFIAYHKDRLSKIPPKAKIAIIDGRLYLADTKLSLRYTIDQIFHLSKSIIKNAEELTPNLTTTSGEDFTHAQNLAKICDRLLLINWDPPKPDFPHQKNTEKYLQILPSIIADLAHLSNLNILFSNELETLQTKLTIIMTTEDLIDDTILADFKSQNDDSFISLKPVSYNQLLSFEYRSRRSKNN